jgi:GMP synthase (glutamine-hydrolysing)
MIKPFLILQLRPEDDAADGEFMAFLKFGELAIENVHRVRMDQESIPSINLDDYSGVIVGGGPNNVSDSHKDDNQQRFEKELFSLFDEMTARDFPYLGACYGLGIFSAYLGGHVSKERYGELVGAVPIEITKDGLQDDLTTDMPSPFKAFAGHKEACQDLAPGAVLIGTSQDCPIQLIRFKQNMYAAQFHPELDTDGLVVRIQAYKHAGYFPPEDADMLIASTSKEDVTIPEVILKRFIEKYSRAI